MQRLCYWKLNSRSRRVCGFGYEHGSGRAERSRTNDKTTSDIYGNLLLTSLLLNLHLIPTSVSSITVLVTVTILAFGNVERFQVDVMVRTDVRVTNDV